MKHIQVEQLGSKRNIAVVRETRLYQVAPISILSYVGEHVLGMPKSY